MSARSAKQQKTLNPPQITKIKLLTHRDILKDSNNDLNAMTYMMPMPDLGRDLINLKQRI